MCLHMVIRGLTQVSWHNSSDIIRVAMLGGGYIWRDGQGYVDFNSEVFWKVVTV